MERPRTHDKWLLPYYLFQHPEKNLEFFLIYILTGNIQSFYHVDGGMGPQLDRIHLQSISIISYLQRPDLENSSPGNEKLESGNWEKCALGSRQHLVLS